MISDKQKIILEFIKKSKDATITKKEAVELIGGCYYTNESKHTGDVLSRMVNRGLLKRIKNGVFKVGDLKTQKETIYNLNQQTIF